MKINGQHYEAAAQAVMQLASLPTNEVLPMLAKLFRNMEAKGAREALEYQARLLKERADSTAVVITRGALRLVVKDIKARLKNLGAL